MSEKNKKDIMFVVVNAFITVILLSWMFMILNHKHEEIDVLKYNNDVLIQELSNLKIEYGHHLMTLQDTIKYNKIINSENQLLQHAPDYTTTKITTAFLIFAAIILIILSRTKLGCEMCRVIYNRIFKKNKQKTNIYNKSEIDDN